MIFGALVALFAAAAAGIFLATRHFLRKRLPVWGALLHGLGGATGFVLVLLIVVREPAFGLARQALYLLIATVVFGCVNLIFHVRKVRHRVSLIAMHALCAVSGVSTLLYAAFSPDTARAHPTTSVRTDGVRPESSAASMVAPSPVESAAAGGASVAAAGLQPAPAPVSAESPEALGSPGVLPLRAIHFDAANATLSADSAPAIEEAAAYLIAHPEIQLVEVQGHADERGEDSRNVALTLSRARVVVAALAAKGVARSRLNAAGYGARCPAEPSCRASRKPMSCHETANYSQDRRVVFLALIAGKARFRGEVACARGAPLIPAGDRRFQVIAAPH
jgi:outer membrane protein OmpA-like peptidoglycan-associated protein